jgi:hypothetical protein
VYIATKSPPKVSPPKPVAEKRPIIKEEINEVREETNDVTSMAKSEDSSFRENVVRNANLFKFTNATPGANAIKLFIFVTCGRAKSLENFRLVYYL